MFNQAELKKLNSIESNQYKFVSLYLNIDQAVNSTEKIEIKLKNLVKKAGSELNDKFISRIEEQINRAIQERYKGIVFFIGKNEEDFKYYTFNKSFNSSVHIENNLHITPLQKLLDEYEKYGVVVLDKEKTRFFTVYLGEIREVEELDDYYPGHHAQGGWSQKRYQGHTEDHLLKHLENTANMVFKIWKKEKFNRLILGGTTQLTKKLFDKLPNELREKYVGSFKTELFKSLEHMLKQSLRIEEKIEREKEGEMITYLEDHLGEGNKAVSGIRDVLKAINEKRVLKLFVQKDYEQAGIYCSECDMLALNKDDCECEGERAEVDLIDEIVQQAIFQKAQVEFVDLKERMAKIGNIGALVRF